MIHDQHRVKKITPIRKIERGMANLCLRQLLGWPSSNDDCCTYQRIPSIRLYRLYHLVPTALCNTAVVVRYQQTDECSCCCTAVWGSVHLHYTGEQAIIILSLVQGDTRTTSIIHLLAIILDRVGSFLTEVRIIVVLLYSQYHLPGTGIDNHSPKLNS